MDPNLVRMTERANLPEAAPVQMLCSFIRRHTRPSIGGNTLLSFGCVERSGAWRLSYITPIKASTR